MTFASGFVIGAFFGCLYWAFITGPRGRLVGDDDQNETVYYGRHDGAGEQ